MTDCIYLTNKSKNDLIENLKRMIKKGDNIDETNELIFIEKKNKIIKEIDELYIFPNVLLKIIRQYADIEYIFEYSINHGFKRINWIVFDHYNICLINPLIKYEGQIILCFINNLASNEHHIVVQKENFVLESNYDHRRDGCGNIVKYFNKFMREHYNKKNYFKNIYQLSPVYGLDDCLPHNKILKRAIIMLKLIVDIIQYTNFNLEKS